MYTLDDLSVMLLSELREVAEKLGIKGYKKLAKQDLIYSILDHQATMPEAEVEKIKNGEVAEAATEEKAEAPAAEAEPEKKTRKPRKKKEEPKEEAEATTSHRRPKPRRKRHRKLLRRPRQRKNRAKR